MVVISRRIVSLQHQTSKQKIITMPQNRKTKTVPFGKPVITLEEIQAYKQQVTSSTKEATRFLMRAGIINSHGRITSAYRENKKTVSYRHGSIE